MKEMAEEVGDLDCKVNVYKNDFELYKKEFDEKIEQLTKRIDRAEADRMDKYYRQVSELQDWVNGAKKKVEDSN